jgi:hypothetical protein
VIVCFTTRRSLALLLSGEAKEHQHILILSKTYPSVTTTSPTPDMKGFLASGVLLLKSNKEYVLTFKILAQVLVDYSFLN